MSIENNQRRTIDGLNTLFCDVINIVESIEINGDNGSPNQIILSNGTKIDWGNISDLIQNLSVSSPLQFTSGTTYDGSVARTLELGALPQLTLSSPLSFTSGTTYTGEAARVIQITNIPNSDLQNSTISGKALGTNLETLNFDNPLTDVDYNGGTARTISIADGAIDNQKLADSTISGVSLGEDLETLNFDAPLSNLDYNGGTARTITIADGDIGNAKLTNSTISGKELGTNLSSLGLYFGLEFIDGSTGYDGTTTRAINTKFKSGGGITADSNGLHLVENSISGITLGSNLNNLTAGDALEFDSGSTYNGGTAKTIKLSPPYQTISDRVSFEDTGVGVGRWLYTITATEWRPNDDSSFYNIHIEDDSSTTLGRAKIATSSLEAIAIIHIPFDWTPSKIFIDCRNSAGSNQTRTYYLYKIKNWGGTGNTYLGSYSTNTETTLEYNSGVVTNTYGAGDTKHSLMIKMVLSSTSDHLGGGYITLTAPSGGL
tara:strand:- start:1920 stop:3386 length:1467 start_codon:yes stop_codon:yes gene_type:complete